MLNFSLSLSYKSSQFYLTFFYRYQQQRRRFEESAGRRLEESGGRRLEETAGRRLEESGGRRSEADGRRFEESGGRRSEADVGEEQGFRAKRPKRMRVAGNPFFPTY